MKSGGGRQPQVPQSGRFEATETRKKSKEANKVDKSPLVLNPDDPKTNPWTVMDTLKAIEAEESLKNDKVKVRNKRMST